MKGLLIIGMVLAVSVSLALNSTAAPATRAATTAPSPAPAPKKKKLDFNRDIRPILSDNCYNCHGPDKGPRKAELRLDLKEGLFGVRDDTYPIVPGKPDDSVLYMRITSDDPDYRMPHKDSNKHLTATQIATIKQWIEEGAEWKGHWAYIPPARPEVPAATIDGFTRNPIDNFVAEKLAEHDLAPSPAAKKETLIRRLSFDLTGLPPTPQEVGEFLNDKSPGAYGKLVDRLLASPRYGERMSVYWMDLVRYGDSIGFHSDNPREVWPWRDWAIRAFNDNKRFDQFTIEQIAGDLLPSATRDQKVASAYNRLLLTTGEGGAQAKEYVKKYEGDRVRNVSTTWMGATMGCCQCHDHKFDPYAQKDFYRLGAFFADIQEPAISLPQPELLLPSPEQEKELNRLDGAIAEARKKIDTPTTQLAAAQVAWEKEYQKANDVIKWTPLTVTEAKSIGGANLVIGKDQWSVLATGNAPATDTYVVTGTTTIKKISGLRIDVVPHGSLPGNGPGRESNSNFVLTELDAAAIAGHGKPTTQPIAFQAATASFEQQSGGEDSPYGRWPAAAAIDGDKFGPKFGWAVLGRTGLPSHAIFETAADISTGKEVTLQVTLKQNFGDTATLGHFRLSVTNSPRPIKIIEHKDVPAEIAKLLDIKAEKRTPEQIAQIAAQYRTISPLLEPVRKELAELNRLRQELVGPVVTTKTNANRMNGIPRTLMSVSGPPRVTRVLNRGNWQDESGEIVAPGVPAFLRQIEVPPDRGATRLDLARWIVARDNPLTARVFVNRLWKIFYGEGLAKPLDDMGSQGQSPSHADLLDWLAVEFMDSGWDIKHVVRLMVTSGTYRQSSDSSKPLREKDPFNKWLARQGAYRLDAEFVRDNALAISGLLVQKIGGPSVRPYQPEGYWDFLNFPKRTYDQDHGESLYRRGLYTWWQRTFLNPSLLNFDAPSHEECTAERVRSNTPQQALTLLNDITYVEAARVFAARILRECNGDAPTRIKWAYKTALSRDPLPAEVPILLELLDKQRQRYEYDLAAADALTDVGEAPPAEGAKTVELAAWTSVARTILNLHETITRN